MKKFYINVTRSGFSLIEVLVFVSILSIFFVSAAAVVTISLRNMKINEHKILATRYAEELMEWLKSQKETDWNDFTNHANNYCFNTSPITDWSTIVFSCRPSDPLLASLFKRQVTLTNDGSGKVTIAITVLWNELGKNYSVPINSIFSPWEQ